MWVSEEERIKIGRKTSVESFIDNKGVIFEDNGETGYLYVVERMPKVEVLDALHIYNVADIVKKQRSSIIKIIWTDNRCMAALILNDYCYAIVDFEKENGYNRNGFPEPTKWQQSNRLLTQEIEDEFMKH